MTYDKAEIFVCECRDVAHQLVFQLWDWGKDGQVSRPADSNCELVVHIPLNHYLPFWKRCWLGIKYIFGYRCRYGYFDVVQIRYEDLPRLKALLDEFAGKVDQYERELNERRS